MENDVFQSMFSAKQFLLMRTVRPETPLRPRKRHPAHGPIWWQFRLRGMAVSTAFQGCGSGPSHSCLQSTSQASGQVCGPWCPRWQAAERVGPQCDRTAQLMPEGALGTTGNGRPAPRPAELRRPPTEEEVLTGFQAAAHRAPQGGLMQLAPWGDNSAHLLGTGAFFRV